MVVGLGCPKRPVFVGEVAAATPTLELRSPKSFP